MNYQPTAGFYTPATRVPGWSSIMRRMFHNYPGAFALRLWNDETIFIGRSMPHFTLVFKSPSVFREWLLRRDTMPMAQAYCAGEIDVEGDLFRALELKNFLATQSIGFADRLMMLGKVLALGFGRKT